VSVSAGRRIAFDVLRRVEEDGAYASDALHAALDAGVTPADAALATELTMGVLRWRALLDFLLGRLSTKPVARLDLAVAIALRIGLYQLRFLDKIPARAAVHESVELVKAARKHSASTLVNAVLRKCAAERDKSPAELLPPALSEAERLAALHSHPLWLVERRLARLGPEETARSLAADNHAARLACAPSDPHTREALFSELAVSGLQVEQGLLLKHAFGVRGGSAARTAAFREGRIFIQDEASQAVPLLLGVRAGDRVLDVCAAPGGKTAILSRAAGPNGKVIAADLHSHRLRAMQAQIARLRLDNVTLVALDASQPLPFAERFDKILVDAPCSGTGTLARHPEIRWRLRPERLAEFHNLQTAILRQAIAQATPGARILYSTCSMEPEENELVVEEALRESGDVQRAPRAEAMNNLAPHLAPNVDAELLFDPKGEFRTLPQRDGTDGFFAALLQKSG
jgi:16S rRNA (cytosine967-C5)-methyltransferase